MEDKDRFKETYDHLVAYIKERFELLRLEFADRSARETSGLASKLVLISIFAVAVLFLSITLAIYLGKLWGRMELGFAVVGGAYIFLFLILALLRKPLLQKPILNSMIKRFFKGGDDE